MPTTSVCAQREQQAHGPFGMVSVREHRQLQRAQRSHLPQPQSLQARCELLHLLMRLQCTQR
ncbi:MAG: hypothetical protein ACK4ZJ_18375, partial [Allorhizobium sp.]